MTVPIIVLNGPQHSKTFERRHILTWRQLSLVWKCPVLYRRYDENILWSASVIASMVIDRQGGQDAILQKLHSGCAAAIFFANGVNVRFDSDKPEIRDAPIHIPENPYSYEIQMIHGHCLAEGLPETIKIYGKAPAFTPMLLTDGMQTVALLDGMPIICYRKPFLFIGVDPWQLGTPSVPVLYRILLNFIQHAVGERLRIMEPLACIRLDDLPTTAEEIAKSGFGSVSDGKRSRMLRGVRAFALKTDSKISIMYSSHYYDRAGRTETIASIMPKSIQEIKAGLGQDVFEIGAHGMIHLRGGNPELLDPREFMDLSEEETDTHLRACDDEIARLFGRRAESFVAPGWGYRKNVTKRVAMQRYKVVIDSSQHVENAECDVLLSGSEQDGLSMVETFRPGNGLLSYADADFWRCYAGAGIPVHYMQHTVTNWLYLRNAIKPQNAPEGASRLNLLARLQNYTGNNHHPLILRSLSAAVLCAKAFLWKGSARAFIRRALLQSSLYAIMRSMTAAGYSCIGITDFVSRLKE